MRARAHEPVAVAPLAARSLHRRSKAGLSPTKHPRICPACTAGLVLWQQDRLVEGRLRTLGGERLGFRQPTERPVGVLRAADLFPKGKGKAQMRLVVTRAQLKGRSVALFRFREASKLRVDGGVVHVGPKQARVERTSPPKGACRLTQIASSRVDQHRGIVKPRLG